MAQTSMRDTLGREGYDIMIQTDTVKKDNSS